MTQDRQMLRDFLLRACHDLRTPVRAVRTNAELLRKTPQRHEGPEFEQILDFLVNGARNLDSLVDGIENYALALRVQGGSSQSLPAAVLLRGVLLKLAAEIRGIGAEITYDDLPRVTGDPDRLMQVLENLLRNALQHSGDAAPRIHISAREQAGEWIFAVHDDGSGLEAEDLERIFRPFERLRSEHGGVGLGLAICREIVAGHGGRIWAESALGTGTTFYFTIEIK
jgi:signal transduction histidine kinase